jgi:hypothetical protein
MMMLYSEDETYVSILFPFSYARTVVESLLPDPFSRGFPVEPPALLISQQRTVQSAPPLTSREDSSLKAREYIDAV